MTLVVCLSDGGGMIYNNRRLSRDRILMENLCELVGEYTLYISDFSAPLFESSDISVIAVSDPMFSAVDGDFAFVEDRGAREYKDKIKRLVIYRWNRDYPFDMAFDVDPLAEGMELIESVDFAGYSHDKITRETYFRKGK